MRPAGEVRRALLQAAADLAVPGQGATLRELVVQAQVGAPAARSMVRDLVRCGALRIVRHRRVDYRNRPVAEYAPPASAGGCGVMGGDLGGVVRAWVSR